jgi:hypothetical protein
MIEDIIIKDNIILAKNGWGEALPENLLEVLLSSTILFKKTVAPEQLNPKAIVVQNSSFNKSPLNHPITYISKDVNYILISPKDNRWAQYAYQFAHEYCHHLIEWNFIKEKDKFGWFEESICELASILSLKNMSKVWQINPPYPNWKSYSVSLNEYADNVLNNNPYKIETTLSDWITENTPKLEKDRYLRKMNNFIASSICDIFEKTPSLWNSITYLNEINTSKEMDFCSFLEEWGSKLPPSDHSNWVKLKERLINKNST